MPSSGSGRLISGSWTVARAALTASAAGMPVSVSVMRWWVSSHRGGPAWSRSPAPDRGGDLRSRRPPLYGGRRPRVRARDRPRRSRPARDDPRRPGPRGGRGPVRRGVRRRRGRRGAGCLAGVRAVAADVHRRLAVRPGGRAGRRRRRAGRRRQRGAAGHPEHHLRRPAGAAAGAAGRAAPVRRRRTWSSTSRPRSPWPRRTAANARLAFTVGGGSIFLGWNATTLLGALGADALERGVAGRAGRRRPGRVPGAAVAAAAAGLGASRPRSGGWPSGGAVDRPGADPGRAAGRAGDHRGRWRWPWPGGGGGERRCGWRCWSGRWAATCSSWPG